MSVNIDDAVIFKGVIHYKDGKITIIQGDVNYTFDKSLIISISTDHEKERYKWAGDILLGINIRQGNNEQSDFSLRANIQRRTL